MDWEINLGGIKIKSGFIVVFLAFAGSVAGGVWTAGELYNRLVVVEDGLSDLSIPDIAPVEEEVSVMREQLISEINVLREQLFIAQEKIVVLEAMKMDSRMERVETRLEDQNIGDLQGNLVQLQTNLQNIMQSQDTLKGYSESVDENRRAMEQLRKDIATFEQDMNDVWEALDEVSY